LRSSNAADVEADTTYVAHHLWNGSQNQEHKVDRDRIIGTAVKPYLRVTHCVFYFPEESKKGTRS
jgi:hypothetical protein